MKLSPQNLADCYTLAEIEAKIIFYQEAMDNAVVKEYKKDTGQGRQDVQAADIDKIEEILSAWIRAKAIKTGTAGIKAFKIAYNPPRSGGVC